MMMIVFIILMLAVFGRLIGFAIRCAWGITKILLYIVFLPVILIGLVLQGMLTLAIPILLVAGVVLLVQGFREA